MPNARLRPLTVAAVMSLLTVAGCSSSHGPAVPSSATQMYLATVNASTANFLTAWRDYQEEACPLQPRSGVCKTNLTVMQTAATAIHTALAGTSTSGGTGFLGAPPAAIAPLVKDTATAAGAVEGDIDRTTGSAIPGLLADAGALVKDLARWQAMKG
jgi:hypothetical protein